MTTTSVASLTNAFASLWVIVKQQTLPLSAKKPERDGTNVTTAGSGSGALQLGLVLVVIILSEGLPESSAGLGPICQPRPEGGQSLRGAPSP